MTVNTLTTSVSPHFPTAQPREEVRERLEGAPRLTVIGTGYLGATHAICMAALGYEVLGVDIDADKIDTLRRGVLPFYEPGLGELLEDVLAGDRLRFTTSFEEAAAFGDVHFLCVGTPQRPDGLGADLSYLHSAVDRLGVHLRRPALVAGKSTVPVGTAQAIGERLATIAPAGKGVSVAWNPEFLREAFAVADTLRPDRLVFGVESAHDERLLRAAFAPVIDLGTPVEVMDMTTAELVKVAANAFLATKISFINAMAEVCEVTGGDVRRLSAALGHDRRIGREFLRAGLGFGGGCLPKDIRAFHTRVSELGAADSVNFLRDVDRVNQRCRDRVVDLALGLLQDAPERSRIAVLGASFKPDSDDVRDSPSLEVAARLAARGVQVTVTDPVSIDNARRARPQLDYARGVVEACKNADVVMVLTEWSEYRRLAPAELADVVRRPVIVDARHALNGDAWQAAGWTYTAPGVGRLGLEPALEVLARIA